MPHRQLNLMLLSLRQGLKSMCRQPLSCRHNKAAVASRLTT
jgi:hypothetical protein